MALTHEDALLLAFRAELDEKAPSTIPRQTTPRRIDRETKEEK